MVLRPTFVRVCYFTDPNAMDVRCDRCQTEYELDDDSVGDSGAAVQCTSCGHTFTVMRPQPGTTQARVTPPAHSIMPTVAGAVGPTAAEWLLQTLDGQFHRFRELTTLQKWIIERKVTRDDRISRTGHAWRPLGEIIELSTFFDVVDEADRARAAAAGTRALQSQMETVETRRMTGSRKTGRPSGTRPSAPSLDSPMGEDEDEGRPMAAGTSGRAGTGPSEIVDERVLYGRSGETAELSSLEGHGRTKKLIAILGFLGAAGLVATFGTRQGGPAPAPPAALSPPAPAPPAPLAVVAPIPSPPRSSAAADPPPAAAATPAPTPVTLPKPTEAEPDPGSGGSSSGGGYLKLVADADRLLENGKTARAQKLYEKALGSRPSGAEALTGLAYVMLDQQKRSTAIAMFKQALGSAGSHGPALFGLAEAYRGGGEKELALEHYRKYMALEPGGRDAPAARRQIKELETGERKASPAPPPAEPAPPPAEQKPPPPPRPEETTPGLVDPTR